MAALINPLKTKIAAGEPVIGTFATVPGTAVMQLLASAGFDWLTIDREHGAIDTQSMQVMINATKGTGAVPLVRVPEDQFWMSKNALDNGALGLFFPLIKTPEQARAAVESTFYPPKGDRGFGPLYAPSRWNVSLEEYAAGADDAIFRVLMIEHTKAVENIDDILSVPGIDVAFIAPFDLSQTLGIAGQFDHPDFAAAVDKIKKSAETHGVALGGLAFSAEQGRDMLAQGYKMLMLSFDSKIIVDAASELLQGVRPES